MHEFIVGTDSRNKKHFPISMKDAHQYAKPHQAVHIEIVYKGKYLIWKREDDRFEIPGGHVNWLTDKNKPETYRDAAIRELYEELNLSENLQIDLNKAKKILTGRLKNKGKFINLLPSVIGKNNEWINLFCLLWEPELFGNPTSYRLSREGNHSARWYSIKEIESIALNNPMNINSALRHLFIRNKILIPIL